MIRTFKRLALAAAVIAVSAAVMPTSATANTAGTASTAPSAENCDHYSGGGSGALVPYAAVHVRLNGTGSAIGAAQLCAQGNLFWGYVVFYAPMPPGKWGNVRLQIDRNGRGGPISTWSCDSPLSGPPNGANGYVERGQTRCWTPKVEANFAVDFLRVVGYRADDPHANSSPWDAWGTGRWV